MTVTLQAPYDVAIAITLLPNPDLEDLDALDVSLNFRQSMNGAFYSYVKSGNLHRLTYTFSSIGRGKMIEVVEFLKKFRGEHIRLTNFRGEIWKVIIDGDPTEFTTTRLTDNSGGPRKEAGEFVLVLVGEKISG